MLDQNKPNESLTKLSQIEINTVSCSFGAGTSIVKNLHEYDRLVFNSYYFFKYFKILMLIFRLNVVIYLI